MRRVIVQRVGKTKAARRVKNITRRRFKFAVGKNAVAVSVFKDERGRGRRVRVRKGEGRAVAARNLHALVQSSCYHKTAGAVTAAAARLQRRLRILGGSKRRRRHRERGGVIVLNGDGRGRALAENIIRIADRIDHDLKSLLRLNNVIALDLLAEKVRQALRRKRRARHRGEVSARRRVKVGRVRSRTHRHIHTGRVAKVLRGLQHQRHVGIGVSLNKSLRGRVGRRELNRRRVIVSNRDNRITAGNQYARRARNNRDRKSLARLKPVILRDRNSDGRLGRARRNHKRLVARRSIVSMRSRARRLRRAVSRGKNAGDRRVRRRAQTHGQGRVAALSRRNTGNAQSRGALVVVNGQSERGGRLRDRVASRRGESQDNRLGRLRYGVIGQSQFQILRAFVIVGREGHRAFD